MSKAKRIVKMLHDGKKPSEIAKALKVSPSYVYYVRSDTKAASKFVSKIFEAVKETKKELPKKNDWVELPKDYVIGRDALPDLVNKPPHYTAGGIDFLDYAEAKGLTENAYLFNVVKYVSRAGKKVGSNPVEDLKKAQFYLNREIAIRERA